MRKATAKLPKLAQFSDFRQPVFGVCSDLVKSGLRGLLQPVPTGPLEVSLPSDCTGSLHNLIGML